MGRLIQLAVLAAVFLILTLMLVPSPSASQKQEFHSINCGGEAYNDTETKIIWEADPFKRNSYEIGRAERVNSSLSNITNVMKSLRYFPSGGHQARKFCYSIPVSMGNRYLLRASFLYGNYDGLNQPPKFVLLLNLDEWTNVTTSASTIPTVHELIISSINNELNICLAPHINSTDTPFISTLESRRLNSTMYNHSKILPVETIALSLGYGLMLCRRINYGATTKAAIRYPDDPYDRIWEANTRGPIAKISASEVSRDYGNALSQPPAEVMATAITSRDAKGNLSFTYPGYGGTGGFRIELHIEEVDEKIITAPSPPRYFSLAFPSSSTTVTSKFVQPTTLPHSLVLDWRRQFPLNLQIALIPSPASLRGPLLNAIELFRWTPQPLSVSGTFQDDVNAIKDIQAHFKLFLHGQSDPCLPKGYEWTWITCTFDVVPRIVEINLASFNLTGDIPSSINNLTNLKNIDLSNNNLGGEIPSVNRLMDLNSMDFHNNNLSGELPSHLILLSKLTKLDVSNNNLCGRPPSFQILLSFSYNGNKRLCDDSTCYCGSSILSNLSMTPNPRKKKNTTRKYIVSISCLGALTIVSMFAFLFMYILARKYNKGKDEKSTEVIEKKGGIVTGLPFVSKVFTYKEISDATLNFTSVLGEGGFGKVYHGLLPNGEEIAVKMLDVVSRQGYKEFYNEVAILSRVRHKNLVSLIGYCTENTYMLVYEYISKGNLQDLLYGDVESTDKPLPWIKRLLIALDASQGLDYLHMGCDPMIIHRDVKTSNILLGEKMQAKVTDFGLSRLKEGDNTTSHVSTINVVGSMGYLDPAYNTTLQLTDKSDVYSFGVVLFELICGRAPIDKFNTPSNIIEWASQILMMQDKIEEIVDPLLANEYKMDSMYRIIDLALQCVEDDRTKRPKMMEVSQLIQIALEIEMDSNYSQDFRGSFSKWKTNVNRLGQ